ncbi:MAG: hypothetical protein JWN83_1164 [Chitinophagaceae bacterium]|nr:hypothetical protein [Chitinophagaceae bacterium]
MKSILKFTAFFLIAMFVFAFCKKEKDLQQTKPPVANAGVDQTIILPLDSAQHSTAVVQI